MGSGAWDEEKYRLEFNLKDFLAGVPGVQQSGKTSPDRAPDKYLYPINPSSVLSAGKNPPPHQKKK
jgi:hypothetical protein